MYTEIDKHWVLLESPELGSKFSFHFSRIQSKMGHKGNEVANSFSYSIILPQENHWRKNRSLGLVQVVEAEVLQAKARQGDDSQKEEVCGKHGAMPWACWCHIYVARNRGHSPAINDMDAICWDTPNSVGCCGILSDHTHTLGPTLLICQAQALSILPGYFSLSAYQSLLCPSFILCVSLSAQLFLPCPMNPCPTMTDLTELCSMSLCLKETTLAWSTVCPAHSPMTHSSWIDTKAELTLLPQTPIPFRASFFLILEYFLKIFFKTLCRFISSPEWTL